MADQFTYNLKQALALFQETWAERDAFHRKQNIESFGHSANWEDVLEEAQKRAQALFQPALLALGNGVPPTLVLETLLYRLKEPHK